MGSNDGAETYDLVGLFLLHSIGEKLNKDNIDFYRDDRLACFKNNNGHQNDKIRKELIKIFQTHRLKLEIKGNLKTLITWTLHLTLTLDLTGHIENQTMTQDI